MSQHDSQGPIVKPTGEELERQAKAKAATEQQASTELRGPLHTELGKTTIEDRVVQKIASVATREVPGVYAMGNAARRTFNSLAERIPGAQANTAGGVSVEKGEQQTAIDVSIVVAYGFSIVEVSDEIRSNIVTQVERATGLEVIEVNVDVTDVHLPEDDDDDTETRDGLK
ncbi:Asp23/Gls24 family envelope stress response protein [Glutamicibacter sp. JL.03c]|uniref:Asp23/Gls24 family envelope stress response protein n=1 Tax=Glutamicibacter sp. JL.03c TaxID=2984842 RepID=UPI0021F7668E|nr:Asp23/Gls24 family envelope stress response protein [Glutamicibacter sp. JL.03c]UYQ77404.1 Asp23/Gls24 family envelope stress response protein [Glutamicibacter sp. JL.03c]